MSKLTLNHVIQARSQKNLLIHHHQLADEIFINKVGDGIVSSLESGSKVLSQGFDPLATASPLKWGRWHKYSYFEWCKTNTHI